MEDRPWITPTSSICEVNFPRNSNNHSKESEINASRADVERLSRLLFGRSIAVVFGGGGARGLSHIGALRAFHEAAIPIDIVGGTSMGAFVAAAHAQGLGYEHTRHVCTAMSKRGRVYKYLPDLTLPMLSLTSGRFFSRDIKKSFGALESADLKLDYYCCCTNLSKDCQSEVFMRPPRRCGGFFAHQ